ncbi:MAG: hypothetical protein Tsb0017_06490 [Geothermobacteraceae bacterium]
MSRKRLNILIILAAMLLLLPAMALAQTLTLTWTPLNDPDVQGYKIYYKADSSTLPLDGTGLSAGPSPIDVGNVSSFQLAVPDDGHVYYFSVTAYDDSGYEGQYSSFIYSDWVPGLLVPDDGQTLIAPSNVTFDWSDAPAGENPTYTLYYGTDPELKVTAATLPASLPPIDPTATALAILLSAALLAGLALKNRFRTALVAALALSLVTLFVGCGGGGGGGSTSPVTGGTGSGGTGGGNNGIPTVVVSGLTTTVYDANDLQPGQTYYWKVVATDADGKNHTSPVWSFTVQ